jgi:hypothetical protein
MVLCKEGRGGQGKLAELGGVVYTSFNYTIVLCTHGKNKQNIQFTHNGMNKLKIKFVNFEMNVGLQRDCLHSARRSFSTGYMGNFITG